MTGYGIDIGAYANPTIEGNTVCAGQVSMRAHDLAEPTIGENATC